MSGKVKSRSCANPVDSATQSLNERILKECHTLYIDPENGLVKIAESLNLNLLAPRKKISVLLIGNHSAGKSSFINWYVEEHVQKTGVAIETQGFTFVTSGRKRESLTGNATLHLYPHYEPLRQIEGVVDYLQTEISTSKQKKFSLVTFVDTPGLVDGDMKYPFDVNHAILWLGDMADLIFVFFDPIGQALCKRTLNIVEHLSEKHADRMKFYLSKADEAGHESDRQRVMMQIVQELCKRPGLNRTGFDMPTIYIPSMNPKGSRCANQIEEVCKAVEKTINQTIQNTLNTLEKDCDQIANIIELKLKEDNEKSSKNMKARIRGVFFSLIGITLPMLLLATFLIGTSHKTLQKLLGESLVVTLGTYLGPFSTLWQQIPGSYTNHVIIGTLVLAFIMLLIAKFFSRTVPTMTRKQKRNLLEIRDYVQNTVKSKKQTLYQDYLQQSVADQDL
ncbi:EH domain-containing protein 1-like [Gigantopelta aegis]|uniref:EH domain-containing protein 1-like n=1 Tax=Gigantopelta aegis TaxID=1735272 RepID=UPI001B88D0E8|nr:EH domain-containing protein 1-like [Gigantopelta aegis]